MNDIAASIGLANIEHLEKLLRVAEGNADRYNKAFAGLRHIEVPYYKMPFNNSRSANSLYTLLVNDVKEFIDYMKDNGVEASQAHTRNDTKSIFGMSVESLPGVDTYDGDHVCIPVGWWVTDEQVDLIIDLVRKYDQLLGG
jgi:dTDP-4-amino-4,6-dideoxygalactose transaminase